MLRIILHEKNVPFFLSLPDYNTVRECHGLPRVDSFSEINPSLNQTEPEKFAALSELYDSVDDIDL